MTTVTILPTFRPFGMEFELFHPTMTNSASRSMVARDLLTVIGERGLVASHFNAAYDKWQLKDDSSLRSCPGGAWELVTPTLQPTAENFAKVEKVLAYLTSKGFKVNQACGHHVHIDARDMNSFEAACVALRYDALRPEINKVLPPSRHDSNWCQPLSAVQSYRASETHEAKIMRVLRRQETQATWSAEERYTAVNLQHAAKGVGARRLEFRQHSGTLEFGKAFGWYSLMCDLIAETLRLIRGWRGQPAQVLARPAIVRSQRSRGRQTVSHVIGMAAPRIPYIEPGSDYRRFLDRLFQNGVITTNDAREFGWHVDGRSNAVNSRLRVTAHWLRRNGAALVQTHRSGENAYVPANGATTMEALFVNPAQVRARLPVAVSPSQMAFTPVAQSTPAAVVTTPVDALIAKLRSGALLDGAHEQTKLWYALRAENFAGRR